MSTALFEQRPQNTSHVFSCIKRAENDILCKSSPNIHQCILLEERIISNLPANQKKVIKMNIQERKVLF